MTTYRQIIYHIVFATKNRQQVLDKTGRKELFAYIWGIIKNKKCHLYRINGVEDHLHLLIGLRPDLALADLVREIKSGSALWLKEKNIFPFFGHWQEGYGAFTVSEAEKQAIISYINSQEEHHKATSFLDEYRHILLEAGLAFDERYLP